MLRHEETKQRMLSENRRLVRDLRRAVSDDQPELARRVMVELDMLHLGYPNLSERFFRQLIKTILNRRFARAPNAGMAILMGLYVQWDRLSLSQRRRLGSALETVFPRITPRASMLCFHISELLGKRMHDSFALDIFTTLRSIGGEHCRRFVPHGLEHIISETHDADLAKSALEKLHQCASDRSCTIRQEAEASLERLQRRAS